MTGHRRASIALIAHGSPDTRHRAGIGRLAARVADHTTLPTRACYLEHDAPSAHDVLAEADGHGEVLIVAPLLLTAGHHWHRDIPAVVRHGGGHSELVAPPVPAAFRAASVSAVTHVHPDPHHVVLAGAGSRHDGARSRLEALAGCLPWPADVALDPGEIARVAGSGSLVVPVLVADGVFADRIRSAARAAGAGVTDVLGDTPEFARTLAGHVATRIPR